jgi:hypothetical protein
MRAASRTPDGSGADRTRAGDTWASGDQVMSSSITSHGISTATGRGRPLRAWENARRMALGASAGMLTCSIHLVIRRYDANALKLGGIVATARS